VGIDADPIWVLLLGVNNTDGGDVASCFPWDGDDEEMSGPLEDNFDFLDWRLVLVPDNGGALALGFLCCGISPLAFAAFARGAIVSLMCVIWGWKWWKRGNLLVKM
jgi:hypothetical protein